MNVLELFCYIQKNFLNSPNVEFFFLSLYLNFSGLFEKTYCLFFLALFWQKTNVLTAVIVALKFILLIALLVFIRGGIPRYRYDFLTKSGE